MRRAALLAGIAGVALAVGLLMYLVDRGGSHALLIPTIGVLAGHHLFGVLGQSLGSFVHTLAFSLLTAAALPPARTPAYGACLAWCAVNIAFEVGQHPRISVHVAQALNDCFGHATPVTSLANYFLRGTFDGGDILASICGALAAAAVLRLTHRDLETQHAR